MPLFIMSMIGSRAVYGQVDPVMSLFSSRRSTLSSAVATSHLKPERPDEFSTHDWRRVVVIIIGVNASNSMADQVSETFTGKFTESTTWYIVGGIGAGLTGLLMVLFGTRGKSS